eukprot:955217-Pelagomonas_calceolata.AAC.1
MHKRCWKVHKPPMEWPARYTRPGGAPCLAAVGMATCDAGKPKRGESTMNAWLLWGGQPVVQEKPKIKRREGIMNAWLLWEWQPVVKEKPRGERAS